ncbi:MAG: AAA family ATPase [Prevotella sp.]|nr:AAA family ATPase [Prevotella sp.]
METVNHNSKIKEDFIFFLSKSVKTSRIKGSFNFTPATIHNYVSFSESLSEYVERISKGKYHSIFEIKEVDDLDSLAQEILNDSTFQAKDKEKNINGLLSGALMYYVCFFNARSYFTNQRAIEGSSKHNKTPFSHQIGNTYRPYITAIKSKPFLLLAGISGTGKSRIVRELAKACWEKGSKEYDAPIPQNFEMVQVKPNWHDSSELIGYVSRVSGEPVFVAGDFLKFVAKAWENPDVPHFLCLDEMNLAPVEQYFAEYLSVVESRKADENGFIKTDPILKAQYEKERDPKTDELVPKKWYADLVAELLAECAPEKVFALTKQFVDDGICIPQNLIVVGTVNMDETTFSFSRKVLDRAMTIEMNEVDLYGGLDERHEDIGKLEAGNLIGTAVEGVDVYKKNKDVCNTTLEYLKAVNDKLEATPFKVAYRTRNEFLLYVVNNLPYNKDEAGNEIPQQEVIARALDEITSMKILSRIEGDSDRIGSLLDTLSSTVGEQLQAISGKEYSDRQDDGEKVYSVSLAKLAEMKTRLKSGYTSFWS